MKTLAGIFAEKGNPWDMEPRAERKRLASAGQPMLEGFERKARVILNRANKIVGNTSGIDTSRLLPPPIVPLEIPEMDQFTKAERAKPHHERGPEKRGPQRPSNFKQKAANIKLQVTAMLNDAKPKRIEEYVPPARRYEPVNKKDEMLIQQEEYSVYSKRDNGDEVEVDRKGYKNAVTSFHRARKRKDTVLVELWAYETGDCLMRYQARPKKKEG